MFSGYQFVFFAERRSAYLKHRGFPAVERSDVSPTPLGDNYDRGVKKPIAEKDNPPKSDRSHVVL